MQDDQNQQLQQQNQQHANPTVSNGHTNPFFGYNFDSYNGNGDGSGAFVARNAFQTNNVDAHAHENAVFSSTNYNSNGLGFMQPQLLQPLNHQDQSIPLRSSYPTSNHTSESSSNSYENTLDTHNSQRQLLPSMQMQIQMQIPTTQQGNKRSYSSVHPSLDYLDDQDRNLDTSSSNSVMSDVNARCIKRLCIRDNYSMSMSTQDLDNSDGMHTSYGSVMHTSYGSADIDIDVGIEKAFHAPEFASSTALPKTATDAKANWNRFTDEPNLKRPNSFMSTDATAGSANTFLSSLGSNEVKVHLAARGGGRGGPPLKRLSTVSIDEMERDDEEDFPGQQDGEMNDSDGHGNDDCHGNGNGNGNGNYKTVNNVLGNLHLERDRRAKEMNIARRLQTRSESASASVSALTTLSSETETATGSAGRQNRWRIPKQVHLQSHSNLG
eukprot:scaffold845_cov274-Chaetoceros_neogracile.AAC.24